MINSQPRAVNSFGSASGPIMTIFGEKTEKLNVEQCNTNDLIKSYVSWKIAKFILVKIKSTLTELVVTRDV